MIIFEYMFGLPAHRGHLGTRLKSCDNLRWSRVDTVIYSLPKRRPNCVRYSILFDTCVTSLVCKSTDCILREEKVAVWKFN